jgi:hypothetical protein
MNQISYAAQHILTQLTHAITQVSDKDFITRSETLNATIGQHLRHTLEFFICLEKGYQQGVVNYDLREHSKTIESDRNLALTTLHEIQHFIASHPVDKILLLEVGYLPTSNNTVAIQTNYFRELTYNIEHAVHHMALMKIGIREAAPYVTLPDEFGIAISTLRYRESSVTEHE